MNIWLKEKNKDVTLKIILFLVSPFFSFLYSLRTLKTKSSYIVLFLTAIFFGMSFSVESGKGDNQNNIDSSFYRETFENLKYINSSEFIENLKGFIAFDDGKQDFYFDTFSFIISRFTDNYHVMFMFFSVIFAYFSLKSLKFLTAENNFDKSVVSYILVYLFLYNQIFNINGLRFPTAAWIAVYSIFQIYRNNNKKYLLLVLITPYFHGSFWILLGVLVIVQLFKRFDRVWTIAFLLSFFVSNLSVQLAQYIQPYLPTFLSIVVDAYTSEDVLTGANLGFGWIPVMFNKMALLYIYIIILLFIRNSKEIKSNPKTKELYLLVLVWASIFSFLMFIPHLGLRFLPLIYPVIAYIWLVHFKDKKYSRFILLLPFVFIWRTTEYIFFYNKVLTYDFYISSPIYLIYKYLVIG